MKRTYFYEIDGRGNLYHQGARLDQPAFLDFFYRNLRSNDTDSHPEYAYVSPCGPELNFVRCAGSPIVFDRLEPASDLPGSAYRLFYNRCALSSDWHAERLHVSTAGDLYYPAPVGNMGRFSPGLTLELGRSIEWAGANYVLTWEGRRIPLPSLAQV